MTSPLLDLVPMDHCSGKGMKVAVVTSVAPSSSFTPSSNPPGEDHPDYVDEFAIGKAITSERNVTHQIYNADITNIASMINVDHDQYIPEAFDTFDVSQIPYGYGVFIALQRFRWTRGGFLLTMKYCKTNTNGITTILSKVDIDIYPPSEGDYYEWAWAYTYLVMAPSLIPENGEYFIQVEYLDRKLKYYYTLTGVRCTPSAEFVDLDILLDGVPYTVPLKPLVRLENIPVGTEIRPLRFHVKNTSSMTSWHRSSLLIQLPFQSSIPINTKEYASDAAGILPGDIGSIEFPDNISGIISKVGEYVISCSLGSGNNYPLYSSIGYVDHISMKPLINAIETPASIIDIAIDNITTA